MNQHWSLLAT